MKKTLLAIATLLLAGAVTAQEFVSTDPSNRNVIIEEYTGVNCTWCPAGHKKANEAMAAHPGHAWAINIHQGSFAPQYTTQWGNALADQTGLEGYPAGTVNRHNWGSAYQTNVMDVYRDYWPTIANAVVEMPSPVNVAARGTIDASTRTLELTVEVYYTAAQTIQTNNLNVVLLQNNVIGPQTGADKNPDQVVGTNQYRHMHMLRDMLTGQWGEVIDDLTVGHCETRTYEYYIPLVIGDVPIPDVNDLEIVVFVAEGHAEILNGAEAEINVINEDIPRFNGFSVARDGNCAKEFVPSFTIYNAGENAARDWRIEMNGETLTFDNTIAAGESETFELPSSILPDEPTEAAENMTDTAKFRILGYTKILGEEEFDEVTVESNALYKEEIYNEYMLRVGNSVKLNINIDLYGSETTVELRKQDDCSRTWKTPNFANNKIHRAAFVLSPTEPGLYVLRVLDSYGDGMTMTNIEPGFKLYDGENMLYSNDGDFGKEVRVFIYFAEAGDGNFVGMENAEEVSFEVYPNPANDIINVRSNEAVRQLDVLDLTGRTVASANSNSVNVATLSAGVYIVRITTASGTGMQKIVKN